VKILCALAAVCGLFVAAPAAQASAPAHRFKNCTDMHKTYKGGVARSGAHDHRSNGGHARYAPHVSTALYNANASMDRDHDHVACEQ
jgi:excalibur calcium-binding domain-containing protein